MADENSLIGRLAFIGRKMRERGLIWTLRRSVEVASRAPVQALIWTLSRYIPYIRSLRRKALIVTYDLESYPISYDICWYLVWADLHRRHRQLDEMHCTFLPIEDHERRSFPAGYDEVVDRRSRAWRFQNICVAAVPLVPSCTGVTVCGTRAQASAWTALAKRSLLDAVRITHWAPLAAIYRDVIARVAAAPDDWGMKAPEQGLRYIRQWIDVHARGRKLVVVTLRQYQVDKARNSRTAEWVAFLKGLDQSRYFPVIVPDTDHALERQDGFGGITLFEEAAWNLGLRMALYESAYMNMFVNSGPASLCILNPRTSYMLFKVTVPGIHLASEQTLRDMGFEPNTQPPLVTARQRWVWEDDRRDVIEREFAAMVARIEKTPCAAA